MGSNRHADHVSIDIHMCIRSPMSHCHCRTWKVSAGTAHGGTGAWDQTRITNVSLNTCLD